MVTCPVHEWQKSTEWDGKCLWAWQGMIHCVHSGRKVDFISKSMPKLRCALGDLKPHAEVMMAASRASWEKELRLFLSLVLSREINKTCSIYSRLHVFPHILRLTVVDQPCCAWDIWGILLNFHCHILRFVYFYFFFWKWAKILNLFLIGFFFFT